MKVVETIEIDKRYDMDKIVSNMLVDETNVTDRALLNYYKRTIINKYTNDST